MLLLLKIFGQRLAIKQLHDVSMTQLPAIIFKCELHSLFQLLQGLAREIIYHAILCPMLLSLRDQTYLLISVEYLVEWMTSYGTLRYGFCSRFLLKGGLHQKMSFRGLFVCCVCHGRHTLYEGFNGGVALTADG